MFDAEASLGGQPDAGNMCGGDQQQRQESEQRRLSREFSPIGPDDFIPVESGQESKKRWKEGG